jgi:hypothetical protein
MIGEEFGANMPDLFSGQNQFAQNPFLSQPSFGGISSIGPLLRTQLQAPAAPSAHAAPTSSQPADSSSALLGLMGLMGNRGGGSLGGGAGNIDESHPREFNALFNAMGALSPVIPFMNALFRSGAWERGASSLGNRVVMPIANAGGSASIGNQLTQVGNTIFGGDSGNLAANTNNAAQVAINRMRTGVLDPHAMPITSIPVAILRANGATDAELRQWGLI